MAASVSILFNAAIVVFTAGAVAGYSRRSSFGNIMRYFTALSNVLCSFAALAVIFTRLSGGMTQGAGVFKYVGTVGVTLTMLTVLVFLGPHIGYKELLSGPDFWLHLACPVLALISYLAWDKPVMNRLCIILAMLPVLAYAVLYAYKVLLAPPEKRWKDFYGFNHNNKWPLSLAAILAATFLISWVLWLI